MPNTDNGRATLASLESRVGGIADLVTDLSRRFEHFSQDIYARLSSTRIQPGTILGVISIIITVSMGVMGAGAIWTSQRITPLENDIQRIERTADRDRKNTAEHEKELRTEIKEARLERREELKIIRDEARAERMAIIAEFKEVRNSIVPRGEHEQRWIAQAAALLSTERRLDETRKTLAEIYSPQDAFKELQRQINEIRQIMMSGPQPAKPGS